MKKIIIAIVIIIVLWVAWYLISPLWRTVELDEASPLAPSQATIAPATLPIDDDFDTMSDARRAEFDAAVAAAPTMEPMAQTMPQGAQLVAQGEFKPRAHDVAGQALLIKDNDQTIIRFEDFETVNGPNLHIYLSSDINSDDYIDLGPIKATKGNVNYQIDSSIDTDRYNKVLVWCVPFRVLFSYAELE